MANNADPGETAPFYVYTVCPDMFTQTCLSVLKCMIMALFRHSNHFLPKTINPFMPKESSILAKWIPKSIDGY